jgi:hypothetical protein
MYELTDDLPQTLYKHQEGCLPARLSGASFEPLAIPIQCFNFPDRDIWLRNILYVSQKSYSSRVNCFYLVAPFTGILLADYFVVRRCMIKLEDCYIGDKRSIYWCVNITRHIIDLTSGKVSQWRPLACPTRLDTWGLPNHAWANHDNSRRDYVECVGAHVQHYILRW